MNHDIEEPLRAAKIAGIERLIRESQESALTCNTTIVGQAQYEIATWTAAYAGHVLNSLRDGYPLNRIHSAATSLILKLHGQAKYSEAIAMTLIAKRLEQPGC